jgi:DNA/RNA-binding domain of Phe-tRNA-synthetase-like protein
MTQTHSQPAEESPVFRVSEAWKAAYPEAHAGVLILRNVTNPLRSEPLDSRKNELEGDLRARYAGQDRAWLGEIPTLRAYQAHYRRFNKTYHVQLQLESIVFKGKSIPSGAPLVEAMFMAELNNLLLTAGHDLDTVRPPLVLDVALGTESYVLLRGTAQSPKAGDMIIADAEGIVSNIVYGPDWRTQINAQTRNVVFTVYAPAGISEGAIEQHLREIEENVRRIGPGASVEMLQVFG